jgi:hypothetical protein
LGNDIAPCIIYVNVGHSFEKGVFRSQSMKPELILTDDMTGCGIAEIGRDGEGAFVELLSHRRSR